MGATMKDGLMLAQTINSDGYLVVGLAIPGKQEYVTANLTADDVRALVEHLQDVLANQAAPTLH